MTDRERFEAWVAEKFYFLDLKLMQNGDYDNRYVRYMWEAWQEATKQDATDIPLNDETRWILGRPNFWCYSVAQVLRQDGHEIETKSEVEQASVIHWLLNLYLKHGDDWRGAAQLETKRIKAEVEATKQAKGEES